MTPIKRILNAAGGRIIAQLTRTTAPARTREVFQTSDWRILILFEPKNPPPADEDHDTPIDAAILGVCTHEPQKAHAIARKIGKKCTAYFRSRLTRLYRQKRLVRPTQGFYRLPD